MMIILNSNLKAKNKILYKKTVAVVATMKTTTTSF